MVRYIRSNVLGFIAIFIALGGIGYAAGLARDSVRSRHIKDGAVKSVDVRDDGLTGVDVDESTLGPIGPGGAAGGDLAGSYPNPSIRESGVSSFEIANGSVGAADVAVTPAARARPISNPALANATSTAIDLGNETFDTGGVHSTTTDPSRLTAPIDGYYTVSGEAVFSADPDGSRQVLLRKNDGLGPIAGGLTLATGVSDPTAVPVTTIVELDAGDYVELEAFQSSGGSLTVVASRTYLAMAWIGPSVP